MRPDLDQTCDTFRQETFGTGVKATVRSAWHESAKQAGERILEVAKSLKVDALPIEILEQIIREET